MKSIAKKTLSATALAVALAIGAGVAAPASFAAEQKPSVSKAATKPIADAQKAIQAKNFEAAIAKLNEVDAIPTRTPYDMYAAAQLRAYALGQLGRTMDALPIVETAPDQCEDVRDGDRRLLRKHHDREPSAVGLHVRQRADRYRVIGRPKSETSERSVPLPPMVVHVLRFSKCRCLSHSGHNQIQDLIESLSSVAVQHSCRQPL